MKVLLTLRGTGKFLEFDNIDNTSVEEGMYTMWSRTKTERVAQRIPVEHILIAKEKISIKKRKK